MTAAEPALLPELPAGVQRVVLCAGCRRPLRYDVEQDALPGL